MKHWRVKPGRIFVFGSNREGRHGAGAAKHARIHFGAVYGQPRGFQGQSYAIVTKELRRNFPPVTLSEIKDGVLAFLEFARTHQKLEFHVTEIGCYLAGFKPEWIAPFFEGATLNVYLPESFRRVLDGRRTRTRPTHETRG